MRTEMSNITWHLKLLATWLFIQQLVQAKNKKNIKVLHYCSFVRGIYWWPVNFLYKGSVMGKVFQYHDIIMEMYEYKM